MKCKFKLVFLFILFSCHVSIAQDSETKAQAYYMAAENAYGNGSFQSAFDKLTETEKVLGTSNPKIEYLKVKCLVDLKKYQEAKIELSKYFELAKENKGSARYNEMLVIYGSIDDLSAESKAISNLQQQVTGLVSDMDATYKRCYYFMQSQKLMEKERIESVTFKDLTVSCTYIESTGNRFSTGFSVLNVAQVIVGTEKAKKKCPYSIDILYKDGKKVANVFFNIVDIESVNRLSDDIIKLCNLSEK